MDEIREILQAIAQSTSVAEAVKKTVEDKKSSTGWVKVDNKHSIFDYKSQEEEITAFREVMGRS